MDVGNTELQNLGEQAEKLEDNTGFSIQFDKQAIEAERANIDPAGYATLDAFLRLPDRLDFPKGITLVVGPNGIGKSTLLYVVDLMSKAIGLQKTSEESAATDAHFGRESKPYTFEEAREHTVNSRSESESIKRKRGIAPRIALHTTVPSGKDNLGITRYHNVTEASGSYWELLSRDEIGYYAHDYAVGKPVFHKGGEALERAGIVGSTQQIIDQRVFGSIEGDLKFAAKVGPTTILLDEPTSNADLQRSLNILHELEDMNERTTGGKASFVIATNEGLLALNRNVPRIDLAHPERGIHYLRDYPLDTDVQRGLQEMGYAPIAQK